MSGGRIAALLLAVFVPLAGCVSTCGSPAPARRDAGEASPPERALRQFLEAVQYRDVERAWKRHAASTDQGAYCRSGAFEKVLQRTREEMTERDCRDAEKMDAERRARLEEDAALLVQILRFACESPEGRCVDYQRRVFVSQVPESDLWEDLEGFEIGEIRVDGERAKAYVDYWSGERSESTEQHRTLELERVDDRWVVTTIFGKDGSRLLEQ